MSDATVLRVGVLVGSLRRESINRRLARAAAALAPPQLSLTEIEIGALPMYDGDLEVDRPAAVDDFTEAVRGSDAIFVVMPEYNRSVPAVLKNAIDWGSKPLGRNVWLDKPVAMTGTSPGAIGTAVGQQHLRQILGVLGASVLGGEAYISFREDLIGETGRVSDATTEDFLRNYLARFGTFAAKLVA